jgi:hypothetical protein
VICTWPHASPAWFPAAPSRRSACIALTVAFRRRSLIVAMTGRSWATVTASPSCTPTMMSRACRRHCYGRRGHDRWRGMPRVSDRPPRYARQVRQDNWEPCGAHQVPTLRGQRSGTSMCWISGSAISALWSATYCNLAAKVARSVSCRAGRSVCRYAHGLVRRSDVRICREEYPGIDSSCHYGAKTMMAKYGLARHPSRNDNGDGAPFERPHAIK